MKNFQEFLLTYQNVIERDPRMTFFTPEELLYLSNERFLITGAGGSIGSRIVHLISSIPGATYLATDRDETALHSLSLSLTSKALFDSSNFELLDIRDPDGVEACVSSFKPTTIIHAAALKHLSVLQKQPREATLTNVIGTASLVDIAVKHGIKKFVNISTDKASDPTSILGISKHLAELYVANTRYDLKNLYTSCRFGNVFNSRGSVIETFISQMRQNSPVTLTNSNISRYFMHEDEAAYLTVKSLIINQSDVHIFDMGEPIMISKIIQNMQKILNSTSAVIITGMREGEKMHEQLVENGLTLTSSSYPHISTLSLIQEVKSNFEALSLVKNKNESEITEFMKLKCK